MVPAIKPWLGWANKEMTDKDQPVFRMTLERQSGSPKGTEAMSALMLCQVRREPEWLYGLVYCGLDSEIKPRIVASPIIRDIHKTLVGLSRTMPHGWIEHRLNQYLVISNGKGSQPTVEDWRIHGNPVIYNHAKQLHDSLQELQLAHTDDSNKKAVVDYATSYLQGLLEQVKMSLK